MSESPHPNPFPSSVSQPAADTNIPGGTHTSTESILQVHEDLQEIKKLLKDQLNWCKLLYEDLNKHGEYDLLTDEHI